MKNPPKIEPREPLQKNRHASPLIIVGVVVAVAVGAVVLEWSQRTPKKQPERSSEASKSETVHSERRDRPQYFNLLPPAGSRDHTLNAEAVLVWGGDHEYTEGLRQNSSTSNIHPADYAGPESCRKCHEDNYESWSSHAHRWMNVKAEEQSVKGDFSGGESARIQYRGGLGEFYRKDGNYMMKLTRDKVVREFKINRTLGSRVHQYYIGVLENGPEAEGHAFRVTDHVLPFGYELTMKEWIPITHAEGQEGKDDERDDPFETPSRLPYDASCSMCHTTPPMGNLMLAMFKRFAAYSPRTIHFEGSNYVDQSHPGKVRLSLPKGAQLTPQNVKRLVNELTDQGLELITEKNAASLGITCEACHLGAKAHVENEDLLPPFFPSGPHVFSAGSSDKEVWGRNAANKNFTCARCHSGSRPQYASGVATWNSTEYSDALRGHCYQPEKAKARGMQILTCVSCHNPHETIGRRWTKSPTFDRDACVRCHTQYEDEAVAQNHTHHPIGSSGSDCMNCHMPKINEGLGDMVRTHAILKPTDTRMLDANQPNACNMCHVEKSIDWTLKYFSEWYGLSSKEALGDPNARGYSDAAIEKNYPDRTQSTALGWLQSQHSGTRIVGADVLLKARAEWALPELLKTLDDPYMEIRQFTVQRLRDNFDIDTDDYAYKLYMTKDERAAPLQKMLDGLGGAAIETPDAGGN